MRIGNEQPPVALAEIGGGDEKSRSNALRTLHTDAGHAAGTLETGAIPLQRLGLVHAEDALQEISIVRRKPGVPFVDIKGSALRWAEEVGGEKGDQGGAGGCVGGGKLPHFAQLA